MKFASLIAIYLCLLGSWNLINAAPPITEEVHVGIQQDLKRVISDYILDNLPEAKDLRFERMWTEVQNEAKVKASFLYSFQDETEEEGGARVTINGYAILNRDYEDDSDAEVWSFDELYILNNHIVFEDGIMISPTEPDAD